MNAERRPSWRAGAQVAVGHACARATGGTTSVWDSGTYTYDGAGNIKAMGQDTFLYDKVSRIAEVTLSVGGVARKQAFAFDAFGNLSQIANWDNGAPTGTRSIAIDSTTNRVAGTGAGAHTAAYDAAGNVIKWWQDGGQLTTYDWYPTGEMRQMSPVGRALIYAYDADGERLVAYDSGMFATQGGISYSLRGLDNKVRRDYIESGSVWMWSKDYVYRGGQLLASISRDPDIATRHYHLDHLGTPRAHTSAVKAQTSKHAYFAFGEEATSPYQEAGQQVNERMRFTGHERDLVSLGATMDDLDSMHARYYSPNLARFLSVDPIDGVSRYPQSWNKYTYTRGDPLKYTDPTGMYLVNCPTGDTMCWVEVKGFEDARQTNLKSKDPAVAAAAAAYGDPGVDNGIKVAFGNPGTGSNGNTGVATRWLGEGAGMGLDANVVIKSGLSGTDLRAAVAHEGQHLADAWGFVNSFSKDLKTWDISKNLTFQQTETNAYRITHSIYRAANQPFSSNCQGCLLGRDVRTPADVNLAIQRILSNPQGPYYNKLNDRQFGLWPAPLTP